MNTPAEPTARPESKSGLGRRIAVSAILGGLVFLVMWIMAFSIVTSLLIGAGFSVIIIAASETLELIATVLDVVASVIFAVLAGVAAVVGAILSFFVG